MFDFQLFQVPSGNIRSFLSLESNFLKRNYENVFFEGAIFENTLINVSVGCWLGWVIVFTALNC